MLSSMAFVRLDSSDPTVNPGWTLPPAFSDRIIVCDRDNPLEGLRRLQELQSRRPGRWVGFLSYDLAQVLEQPRPSRHNPVLPLYVFAHVGPDQPKFDGKLQLPHHRHSDVPLRADFTPTAYLAAVQRCKDYIAAGDIYQVNLSQRFTVGLRQRPYQIYQRLMQQYPALYGGYLDFGDFALICNSPELFLRVEPLSDGRRRVTTRPIKGTRPRAPGMDVELRDSIKDQAELNMIVDLERNDLGRVCQIGSVKVTQPRVIEAHPTVYHGVATIEGILRSEVTFVDLLCATFPGGSITGAPKIRAMQIIDELEPVPRGPYCGAIGFLDADGSMQFNIAIRTMVVADGLVHIHVGGGIVADSDPAAEYDETLIKARAMFAALGIATPESCE